MAYRGYLLGPGGGFPSMFSLRREIDRLFEDAYSGNGGGQESGQSRRGPSFTPAVDVREEERDLVLHMDLPGIRPEDVDISVENGMLTVRGERSQRRKEGEEGRYQFAERSYGSFVRQFHLPQGVDEEQISADFEHGELTLRIPKPQAPQPRRIQVNRGGQQAVGGGGGQQQQRAGQGDSVRAGATQGGRQGAGAGGETSRQ